MTLKIIDKLLPKGHYEEGRKHYRPEIVVIHIGEALQNQIYLEFLNTEKSSHYCVARNGEIWRFVNETDSAWGNGIVDHPVSKIIRERLGQPVNNFTLSIEHEGWGKEDLTPEQYKVTSELVADICKRWLIPLDGDHIIPHRWINTAKTCPGICSVDKIVKYAQQIRKEKEKPEIKIEEIKKKLSIIEQLVALYQKLIILLKK